MNATTFRKIENNSLIRRWNWSIENIKAEINAYPYLDNFKLYEKLGRLEMKVAIKKAKIVYGRDDYHNHIDEFLD